MESAEDRALRVAALHEQYRARVAAENQRMAEEAAIHRCDRCREVKHEQDDTVHLPNGLVLSRYVSRCAAPDAGCTARVCSYLPSESAVVSNRIIDWLETQPELKSVGAGSLACLSSEWVLLTYRFPVMERVIAAVAAVPVEEFRERAEPGAAADGPRL